MGARSHVGCDRRRGPPGDAALAGHVKAGRADQTAHRDKDVRTLVEQRLRRLFPLGQIGKVAGIALVGQQRSLGLRFGLGLHAEFRALAAAGLTPGELRGITVDERRLARDLGVPVVPTSARFGKGLAELNQAIYEMCIDLMGPAGLTGYDFAFRRADSLEGDPITHLCLTEQAHADAAATLCRLADKHCEGRIVATGGGGYNRRNLARAWTRVVQSFADWK